MLAFADPNFTTRPSPLSPSTGRDEYIPTCPRRTGCCYDGREKQGREPRIGLPASKRCLEVVDVSADHLWVANAIVNDRQAESGTRGWVKLQTLAVNVIDDDKITVEATRGWSPKALSS